MLEFSWLAILTDNTVENVVSLSSVRSNDLSFKCFIYRNSVMFYYDIDTELLIT